MKKWGFLDQNQSEFSFFQKKKKCQKKIALVIIYIIDRLIFPKSCPRVPSQSSILVPQGKK